jgi:hypothetical protein
MWEFNRWASALGELLSGDGDSLGAAQWPLIYTQRRLVQCTSA